MARRPALDSGGPLPRGLAGCADGFGPERAHPHTGPVTTEIPRFEMLRRTSLAATGQVVELGAWVDGAVVGSRLVFVDDGVASLHDVAVLDGWRRRGIGAALVAAAVRHAR